MQRKAIFNNKLLPYLLLVLMLIFRPSGLFGKRES